MTNSTNAKKALKLYGMPWWFATATILVVYLAAYLGVLTTDMAGTLALMLAIAWLSAAGSAPRQEARLSGMALTAGRRSTTHSVTVRPVFR